VCRIKDYVACIQADLAATGGDASMFSKTSCPDLERFGKFEVRRVSPGALPTT
jgi:hypothetical protein